MGHLSDGGLLGGHLGEFLAESPLAFFPLSLVEAFHLLLHALELLGEGLLHALDLLGAGGGFGAAAARLFAISGARLVAAGFVLHLLEHVIQEQGEVVEGGHHILLVGRDDARLAVGEAVEGLAHVQVDEADLAVHDALELGDALAEGKQAVLHHLRIVLELALELAVRHVARIVLLGVFHGGHEVFLIEGQGDDVLEQRAQRLHVLLHGLLLLLLHGALHLLGHLLHFPGRVLLAFRGLLLLAAVELFPGVLHALLNLLLELLHHGHAVGVLQLLVELLGVVQGLLDLVEFLIK